MKSKFAKEETATVDALGEAEVVGKLKEVVAAVVPAVVSSTAVVVAGGVSAVSGVVVFKMAVTEVNGTVVMLVEGTVVAIVVEGTAMVVGAMVDVETVVVMAEEFFEKAILARRSFKKAISSSPEILCAKKMTQTTKTVVKFIL